MREPVALRKESVDRNFDAMQIVVVIMNVALRKESVDRNANFDGFYWWVEVALRKESVDRNLAVWAVEHAYQLSLSARRAWIEIIAPGTSVFRAWSRSPQGERG